MIESLRRFLATAFVAAALAACGGGGGISGSGITEGTMRLAITDAPSCGYDAVNITIEKIRVNQNAGAGDSDAGWSEIVLAPAQRIDLLSLTNGVLFELGQTPLPAGHYTQMRLILAANGVTAPFANSVVPAGGSETALTTPSAQQSGLKLNIAIDVQASQVADFVLDFDACKSIVKRGNSGQYNLKPVISVIPRLSDAGMRVVGYLDPALAAGASVSLQAGGVPVKATLPDGGGQFVLYPVPAGSYDLVLTAPGRVTAVMTGVPVVTTAYTYVNPAAAPITLPALLQPARAVTGTLSPPTATVRATQTLAGGPTIEVAWAAVDPGDGSFAFALALDAPLRTAYVANATSLVFTPDGGAAGLYRLEAASAGATQTVAIDVNAAVPPIVFTFP